MIDDSHSPTPGSGPEKIKSSTTRDEPLDEQTELLMWEYRIASRSAAKIHARNVLRQRIRELVEEARRAGESHGAEQVRRTRMKSCWRLLVRHAKALAATPIIGAAVGSLMGAASPSVSPPETPGVSEMLDRFEEAGVKRSAIRAAFHSRDRRATEQLVIEADEEARAARTSLEDYFRTLEREIEALKKQLQEWTKKDQQQEPKPTHLESVALCLCGHREDAHVPFPAVGDLGWYGCVACGVSDAERCWSFCKDPSRASVVLAVDPSRSTPKEVDLASKVSALLSDNERLRNQWEGLAWHGCLTGDCPHDTQAECVASLANAFRETVADETPK